jgi:Zn-dependent protease/predicted transcriptional regulator
MGANISLGRVLGIPLGVSYSWFLILGLVTYVLYRQYGDFYPEWSAAQQWLLGVVSSVLFFSSVLVHELSHSVLAIKKGIPVKGITLFIFGGVSQISREAERPYVEFIISAVGPFSSLVLCGLFAGLFFTFDPFSDHLGALFFTLAWVNFSLAVFNLLPGFPLDGGRVLRSIIWAATDNYWRATLIAARAGQATGFLMMAGGLAILLFMQEFQGIWISAVGWFLTMAASASYRQFKVRRQLDGLSAAQIMNASFGVVPGGASLESLAGDILNNRHKLYLVVHGLESLGIITFRTMNRVPRDQWATTLIQQAMRPLHAFPIVSPFSTAISALEIIEERNSPLALVFENQQCLGYITQEHALRTLRGLPSNPA